MQFHFPGAMGHFELRCRLRSITTNDADIDDMVQHAELQKKERQRKNNWPEIGSVFESKLLFVIGRNHHRTKQRKKKREVPLVETMLDKAESSEEIVMKKEIWTRVREAVQCLPSPQKQVFERVYIEGEKVNQAALEMNIPNGTAKNLLFRARQNLRISLKNLGK
jgi:RNA polymerase sigma factor (sigma-70 family)